MAAHLKLAGADDGGSQMLDGVRVPTEVRLVAVDALLPYARNSRNHDKAQVAAIARSMKEVGFTNPLLIADGGILAGQTHASAMRFFWPAPPSMTSPESACRAPPGRSIVGWLALGSRP